MKRIYEIISGSDLFILLGVSLIGYGISLVSIPAALVTVGVIFTAMGMIGALRRRA